MKKYKLKRVTQNLLVGITCDKCKKFYDDTMEIQEFLSWDDEGGYSSVFGDLNRIQLDLCQHCVKQVLGKYLRITKCGF